MAALLSQRVNVKSIEVDRYGGIELELESDEPVFGKATLEVSMTLGSESLADRLLDARRKTLLLTLVEAPEEGR